MKVSQVATSRSGSGIGSKTSIGSTNFTSQQKKDQVQAKPIQLKQSMYLTSQNSQSSGKSSCLLSQQLIKPQQQPTNKLSKLNNGYQSTQQLSGFHTTRAYLVGSNNEQQQVKTNFSRKQSLPTALIAEQKFTSPTLCTNKKPLYSPPQSARYMSKHALLIPKHKSASAPKQGNNATQQTPNPKLKATNPYQSSAQAATFQKPATSSCSKRSVYLTQTPKPKQQTTLPNTNAKRASTTGSTPMTQNQKLGYQDGSSNLTQQKAQNQNFNGNLNYEQTPKSLMPPFNSQTIQKNVKHMLNPDTVLQLKQQQNRYTHQQQTVIGTYNNIESDKDYLQIKSTSATDQRQKYLTSGQQNQPKHLLPPQVAVPSQLSNSSNVGHYTTEYFRQFQSKNNTPRGGKSQQNNHLEKNKKEQQQEVDNLLAEITGDLDLNVEDYQNLLKSNDEDIEKLDFTLSHSSIQKADSTRGDIDFNEYCHITNVDKSVSLLNGPSKEQDEVKELKDLKEIIKIAENQFSLQEKKFELNQVASLPVLVQKSPIRSAAVRIQKSNNNLQHKPNLLIKQPQLNQKATQPFLMRASSASLPKNLASVLPTQVQSARNLNSKNAITPKKQMGYKNINTGPVIPTSQLKFKDQFKEQARDKKLLELALQSSKMCQIPGFCQMYFRF